MAAPGAACDETIPGQEPQGRLYGGHYDDSSEDNGGGHVNSGIPNRAFYLVAAAMSVPL